MSRPTSTKRPEHDQAASRSRQPVEAPRTTTKTPQTAITPAITGDWWRIGVIGALALILALGLLDIIQLIARPLGLLVAAIVVAEALSPIVNWLERRLPRGTGIALVYVTILLLFGLAGWVVVPVLVDQATALAENLPDLVKRVQGVLNRFDELGVDIASALQQTASQLLSLVGALPLAVASSVIEIILVIALSIYWLLAKSSLRTFFLSLFPAHRHQHTDAVLSEMGHTMGGFVRGAVLDGLIIGVITYIGLTIIGVQYALVLALIAGVFEIIPIVGPNLAAIPALVIALLESPTKALMVLIFYIVVQQIEGNLVTPYIMHSQTDIPPLLVLVALVISAATGSVLWILISIPLSGALFVLVKRVLAPLVRHWTGVEDQGGDVAVREEATAR